MKKNYIQPIIEAYRVRPTIIIAASIGIRNTSSNTEEDALVDEENGKGDYIWDEEW